MALENQDSSMDEDELVDHIEMPRKITLFRVLVERKLGIDWEHGMDESYANHQLDDSRVSLQTNQF